MDPAPDLGRLAWGGEASARASFVLYFVWMAGVASQGREEEELLTFKAAKEMKVEAENKIITVRIESKQDDEEFSIYLG